MSIIDPEYYLWQLFECAQAAISYVEGMDEQSFLFDRKTRDAVLTRITALAEAAEKMSLVFNELHANVPWNEIRGMRNRIVHDYHGIDSGIIWEVCQSELPEMVSILSPLLAQIVGNGKSIGPDETVQGYLVGLLDVDGRKTAVLMYGKKYCLYPWNPLFAPCVGALVELRIQGENPSMVVIGKKS